MRPGRTLVVAVVLFALHGSDFAAEEDRPVALPPFLVEEKTKGPPWRFAEVMGYEVLSRCNDAMTRRVVEAHFQLHVLLGEVLPPALRYTVSVPRTLILYDEELQPAASQEVIARLVRTATPVESVDIVPPAGMRGFRFSSPARHYSFLPNLRLWDRDSMAIFMVVRKDSFDPDRLALTYDYISFLVKNRLPALPLWFTSGFLSLYGQLNYSGSRLVLPPLEWISDAATTALKKEPKTPPPFQPLAEFFTGELPSRGENQAYEPIKAWQAQAALFVRWGLDPAGAANRAAFWKFVERMANEGSSEKLFQECFGVDYATALGHLADYLPKAVRREVIFKPARATKLPPWVLRSASDGEVSRIKGDWERLEVPYVKGISADLAPKYLEQARRTLRRAYDHDDRDPRLLAVLGLCECDAGNNEAARGFLEAAAQGGAIRPRANYELARLRFAECRAKPGDDNGRLSTAQLAEILTPLFAARAEKPPLPEVYELIAETWANASATPTRAHLAVLDEGVRLFPRRPSLVLCSAELNLRYGYREEATALATLVTRIPLDRASRERAAALQQKLATK